MVVVLIKSNTDKLQKTFKKAPRIVTKELNRVLKQSLGEIIKRETDTYFKFKTSFPPRTGNLQSQFKKNSGEGLNKLKAKKTLLHIETYSPAHYADYVVNGRYSKNNFYERILKASQPAIKKHSKKGGLEIIAKIIKEVT